MSGGGGGSTRVPIADNVRKIIDDVRVITGKQHTDEEIYSVLKDCSMDPNETAQKLLYLDTFQVVRRRRDWKKEDSRLKQGGQGRGGRGASGGYSSNFNDGRGGRNGAIRRENRVNRTAERSHALSTQSVMQKAKTNTTSQATRVPAVTTNGATIQTNGNSGHGSTGQSPVVSVPSIPKSSSADNVNKVVEGNKVGDLPPSQTKNSVSVNSTSKKNPPFKSNGVENNQLSQPSQSSPSSPSETANVTEVPTSKACVQSSTKFWQPVTFPSHFHVPKALKSGLTFGSFNTLCPSGTPDNGTGGDNNTSPALESSIGNDKAAISRPPYPANFFPYAPYFPQIYMPQVHQYLAHNSVPQQPSASGNMYLPAAAAAAANGIKLPLPPQFMAGTNTGNTAHIGIPSGSFMSPPVGYVPSPTAKTGASEGNEDLSMSHLKENQIYTTGQQSEGSVVWIPAAPGQDISNLQANSLYSLAPQGQHLPSPPASDRSHSQGVCSHLSTGADPSYVVDTSATVSGCGQAC